MHTVDELKNKALLYIEQFKKIVGDTYVFTDEESLNNYAHDETENLHFLPAE